jgi:DNA (cytosine-5)-methyltransferase 1
MNDSSINSFLSVGQNGFAELNHASFFTGIGGFDLAAQLLGWNNIFQVEINDYCLKLLNKNFPNVKKYSDIRDFDGKEYKGRINVVSGGFPCKQTSVAASIHGKRNGLEGEDSGLWFELYRVIREILPSWAVIENVQGVKKWENIIKTSLEEIGYTVSRVEQKASFYGLPHSRRRNIYVANINGARLSFTRQRETPTTEWAERLTASRRNWLDYTPGVSGSLNGIPNRMDRIIALGNAIVPQVALEIFKAIQIADRQMREGEKTINTVKHAHS